MNSTDALITSSLSDVGRTRKENQDACGEFSNSLGERLLIVADGMGGHTGGGGASRLCIEAVARLFSSGQGSPEERLRAGLEEAIREIFDAARQSPELAGMGTTGVALLAVHKSVTLTHLPRSRVVGRYAWPEVVEGILS